MENVFEYYDSVEEQIIEWLWYPYIPYGKLTLLQRTLYNLKKELGIRSYRRKGVW